MSIPAITAFRSRPDTSPPARNHLSNLRFGSVIDDVIEQIEEAPGKQKEAAEFKKLCNQVIKPKSKNNKSVRGVDFLAHVYEHGAQNIPDLIKRLKLTDKDTDILNKFIEEMAQKDYLKLDNSKTYFGLSYKGTALLKAVYPALKLPEKGYSYNGASAILAFLGI